MKERYTGRYVSSGECSNTQEAWQKWLVELIKTIQEFPGASFAWRLIPECIEEKDFSSYESKYVVQARLTIDLLGDPIPVRQPRFEEFVYGFGLKNE